MTDERSKLESLTAALLRYVPEAEWEQHVYPSIRARNGTLSSPLPDEEVVKMIQLVAAKERGRQIVNLARTRKELSPIWLTDLLAMETARVEWLVEDLLPVGAIGVLSGDPGSFKTWTLLHIASRVANGEAVFGKFKTKKGKVLIIDEENQIELLKERMLQLGATREEICFSSQFGFKVDKEENMEALQTFIAKNNIQLVMIDSLVRVNSKDENVAREIADLFAPLKILARNGATILLTHHHRKQPATAFGKGTPTQSLRGSSDILASVDTHLAVTHHKADRRLVFDQNKSRYSKEINPFEITVIEGQDGSISFEYEGEVEKEPLTKDQAKESILIQLETGPVTRAQLEMELPLVGKSAIAIALREMVADGSVRAHTGAHGKKTYFLKDADSQLDIPI